MIPPGETRVHPSRVADKERELLATYPMVLSSTSMSGEGAVACRGVPCRGVSWRVAHEASASIVPCAGASGSHSREDLLHVVKASQAWATQLRKSGASTSSAAVDEGERALRARSHAGCLVACVGL